METAETTEAKCRRLGIWITAEAVKELVIPMAGQISKCSNVPLAHFGKIVFQQSGRRHCIDSRDVGILEINVVDKGGLLESASPSYSQEWPHIHEAEMRRFVFHAGILHLESQKLDVEVHVVRGHDASIQVGEQFPGDVLEGWSVKGEVIV